MATSEGIPSSIDIEFLELNDNPYLCFVKIEKISLLDNSKLSVNVLDTIIDGWTVSSHRSCMQPKLRAN